MIKLYFLIFITLSVFAEEFNPRTDIIAPNYEAGSFLMYDCREKHWVCVQEPFYKNCEELRAMSKGEESGDFYPCAPIGKFPTKQSCYQRTLFLSTHNHGARFCIKEDLKRKAIEFQ